MAATAPGTSIAIRNAPSASMAMRHTHPVLRRSCPLAIPRAPQPLLLPQPTAKAARPASIAAYPLPRASIATKAAPGEGPDPLIPGDPTFEGLRSASGTQKNLSFAAFWIQLALTLVSAGILLFSVFVQSNASNAGRLAVDVTKGFTLVGVLLAFISTFFAHGFLRLARRLAAGNSVDINWLRNSLATNNTVNLLGIGITTIGLQASVGTLVGKTLLSATSSSLQYNPSSSLVSLDVFALQASTNILLCHLVGLVFVSLMLRVVRNAVPKGVSPV